VPGLGASLGRGGATTYLQDLVNSDAILIMGSNMAEAHPVAFRFVMQARERGAQVIHVDPRFTRTSACASLYVPIRPGTDIAFLGGLIRYVLERGLFGEYVAAYTNAGFLVREDDQDLERDEDGRPVRVGLDHPRSVLSVLRRHYERYTPERVSEVCGTPVELFGRVAEALVRASGRERTACICYAVGWTQHTHGVQNIRAAAILQLLLGNIGRPGGGILALRGHANIQGATDLASLYHILPGYLPAPRETPEHATQAAYVARESRRAGLWRGTPRYLASLLTAWYGRPDAYDLLPKSDRDRSFQAILEAMDAGEVRGCLIIGQNPAAGAPNAAFARRALRKLDWLVIRDYYELETALVWREEGGGRPEACATEVFLMPAAMAAEKAGSLTNTMRLVQWHEKAAEPPGDARSELWFVHQLARRLGDVVPHLRWEYPEDAHGEPDARAVLREINGVRVADGSGITAPSELADDGSTACGSWIHAGVFPAPDRLRAASRSAGGPEDAGWAWSWPMNRRMLYNRASVDPATEQPWSERKAWRGEVPDGDREHPFLMLEDGVAQLFAPGLADGPLPRHYEPVESPVRDNPLEADRENPRYRRFATHGNPLAEPADPRWPLVLTTYRLTEHHLTGVMTRWLPWLAELMPELFCEISPELAGERGIGNGDRIVVSTPRGEVRAKALVTPRIRPFRLGPRTVHAVGLPWHFGYRGLVRGDVVNDLSVMVGDPNVAIQETKAFVCDVRRA
jgi:formate dehydrogenase major subunit